MEYSYTDIGYYHLGTHRQILEFDPYAITGNESLLGILYSASDNGDTYNTLFHLMEAEFAVLNSDEVSLPISFLMIIKSIQLSLIQLIIDGVFNNN